MRSCQPKFTAQRYFTYGCFITALLFSQLLVSLTAHPAERAKSPNTPPRAAETAKPVPDLRGTNESPLVIKVIPDQKTAERSAKEDQEQDRKAALEWWTVVFTGALTLFALVQSLAMVYQGKWLRRNVKITEDTADAAKRSADVAEASIKTMQSHLRAYISVEGDPNPIRDGPPGKLQIHLVMKNVGQTPAHKVTHWVNAALGGEPAQYEGPNDQPDAVLYLPAGAVVPWIALCTTMWSRALFEMPMENGDEVCLYVWGEVRYTDAFDNSHSVKFRFMKKPATGRSQLDYCPAGNEAD